MPKALVHAKVLPNHPTTPQPEAETALALAFRLMQKYDLDEDAVSGILSRFRKIPYHPADIQDDLPGGQVLTIFYQSAVL